MNLRDEMTGISEEQLCEKLKRKQNPTIRDVDLFKQNGKLYLIEKLMEDKELDAELKEKWKKLLGDIPYYQQLKGITDPFNDIIIKAKQDNKLYLVTELEIDTDVKIRKSWSVLLGKFIKEYQEGKKG